MADEFPLSDEEFDTVDQDEYELAWQLEAENNEVNRIPVASSTQKTGAKSEKVEELQKSGTDSHKNTENDSIEIVDKNQEESIIVEKEIDEKPEETRKRKFQDTMQDLERFMQDADIEFKPFVEQVEKRPRWDDSQSAIEAILKARKVMHENVGFRNSSDASYQNQINSAKRRNGISKNVPSWNFVALTRDSDAERFYIRFRELTIDNYETSNSFCKQLQLLNEPFYKTKEKAEEILKEKLKESETISPYTPQANPTNDQLWVEKYQPRSYGELLSDETVNRTFLTWLKLWDRVVFNKNPKKFERRFVNNTNAKDVPQKNPIQGTDAKGIPIQRICLLTGPPGLGKTTLAHVVAKHAGYNVVEVNASDDRGPEAFKIALTATTQMKAVMGSQPKPNCLVLDEIDGAPAASIELLIKFVEGKLLAKKKKNKETTDKNAEGCKRPIVCICNEPYTPSLRSLRNYALVIPVPEVTPARLAQRLSFIADKEKIHADPVALEQLAVRCGCDIRACLGALQYMGEATFTKISKIEAKDTRKGLFDAWREIFKIPLEASGPAKPSQRIRRVLKAIQNDETERLAQGVFHNYLEILSNENVANAMLVSDWFLFFQKITTAVMENQFWSLMPYTNHCFVAWHLIVASPKNPILKYPSTVFEVQQKINKNRSILISTQKMTGINTEILTLDVAPVLPEILNPNLRTVSGHLLSQKERSDMERLVDVMLSLGLSFVQERSVEGMYDYVLDPNLVEVGIIPDPMKTRVRETLSYVMKQIVAQELEVERIKRATSSTGILSAADSTSENQKNSENKEETQNPADPKPLPNHLKQNLEPVQLKPSSVKHRDFFRSFVDAGKAKVLAAKVSTDDPVESEGNSAESPKERVLGIILKHGVRFRYKEGFSNSVRRNVKMKELVDEF